MTIKEDKNFISWVIKSCCSSLGTIPTPSFFLTISNDSAKTLNYTRQEQILKTNITRTLSWNF